MSAVLKVMCSSFDVLPVAPLSHCMFQSRVAKPPSVMVNWARRTFKLSPAIAKGFEPGVMYQLPPSIVKPLPAANSAMAPDIPTLEISGSSEEVEPMVNQLSYWSSGNAPKKNPLMPEPKLEPAPGVL